MKLGFVLQVVPGFVLYYGESGGAIRSHLYLNGAGGFLFVDLDELGGQTVVL